MPAHRPGYAALEAMTLAWARADAVGRRALMSLRLGLGAMLVESLSGPELQRLSVRLYGALWTPRMAGEGLREWEERWFLRRLPPAPARIFLGGAGSGREAAWLLARGYQVDAAEPAPELVAGLGQVIRGGLALTASYEDLARAVLDGEPGPLRPLAERRYDAVIMGWASLTHVIQPADRERAIRTMTRLTDGPILASFWMKDDHVLAGERARATRIGRMLGRRLGQVRLGAGEHTGESNAFGHAFTRREIDELGNLSGRELVWEAGTAEYPHVTFLGA